MLVVWDMVGQLTIVPAETHELLSGCCRPQAQCKGLSKRTEAKASAA